MRDHLAAEIELVAADVRQAARSAFRHPEVGAGVGRLGASRVVNAARGLVPSHTDPNNSNFLVTVNTVYLIDWDGVALSDPMRDPGLILWWYVPEDRWPEAFAHLGIPESDPQRDLSRVYWWAAVTSLKVALWIDRHDANDEAIRSFLDDFLHAERGLPNPKRTPCPPRS